jgi:hypothetical protein
MWRSGAGGGGGGGGDDDGRGFRCGYNQAEDSPPVLLV